MASTYPDQISERQGRFAVFASKVAQSTRLASLQATSSFTQALLAPMFAATSFTLELFEQQVVLAKLLADIWLEPPAPVALYPRRLTAADQAVPRAARETIDHAAETFGTPVDVAAGELVATAQANAKIAGDAVQARVATADDAAPGLVSTVDGDQEIELRAERLVIDKQRVQHGEARVRKEVVTEIRSFDVPVSHEELVIDRHTGTGNVDADSAPIADETIRIPLTEEQVTIAKQAIVLEEVEIGKRRIEGVEHISDTVRHEDLRVDNPMTNRAMVQDPEKLVMKAGDDTPALITPAQAVANADTPALITPAQALANDDTPALITPAQALAKDDTPAIITPVQALAKDDTPALITPAQALANDDTPALITPVQAFANDDTLALITPAQALANDGDIPALATPPVQALAKDDTPAPAATDGDPDIQLRAERLVVNKQRVQNGKARVRKEIVTEMKSFDVPVSHEELVIDRQAVTGDVDVDSAPIADETIRVPLTEEQIDIAKQTVVLEEVEIGKHRVEGVEHISDTVRHEELRVDDPTTNHNYEPAF